LIQELKTYRIGVKFFFLFKISSMKASSGGKGEVGEMLASIVFMRVFDALCCDAENCNRWFPKITWRRRLR
jgi:hypothetical protein